MPYYFVRVLRAIRESSNFFELAVVLTGLILLGA
jgi:hypothetical protein